MREEKVVFLNVSERVQSLSSRGRFALALFTLGFPINFIIPAPLVTVILISYILFNPLNAKVVAANFLVARSLFSSKRSVGSVRAQKRLATL